MSMIRRYQLYDEAATAALAVLLADRLQPGDAILLDGALGVGKTCFARALIQHLSGSDTEVPSPSFNLVLTYDIPPNRFKGECFGISTSIASVIRANSMNWAWMTPCAMA